MVTLIEILALQRTVKWTRLTATGVQGRQEQDGRIQSYDVRGCLPQAGAQQTRQRLEKG